MVPIVSSPSPPRKRGPRAQARSRLPLGARFRGHDGKAAGTKRYILTTLMSAFSSTRRINPWLPWKRLHQALAGKAGGAAVMTTVDHPLMRGSKPHDR